MRSTSKGKAGKRLETIPSGRLRKCLAAGGIAGRLLPLLKKWTKKELHALLEDVAAYYEVGMERLERKGKKMAGRLAAERPSMLKDLQAAKDRVGIRLLAVCSEVFLVALYYLNAGKAKP